MKNKYVRDIYVYIFLRIQKIKVRLLIRYSLNKKKIFDLVWKMNAKLYTILWDIYVLLCYR